MKNCILQFKNSMIVLLLILLSIGCASAQAQPQPREVFTVTWTDVPPELNLILVDDAFILQAIGNPNQPPTHYRFTPLPPLKLRWGHSSTATVFADLQRNSASGQELFCGQIQINLTGHGRPTTHDIALSIVDPSRFVILDFNNCQYHNSHGGLAHAHR